MSYEITNIFETSYNLIEKEVLLYSNYVHFSDSQLTVYSPYIADLIVKIAVQIESISKELYYKITQNSRDRRVSFDTDCLKYLDEKFNITKKHVKIFPNIFNFTNPSNILLKPLQNCHLRGNGDWKNNYQALKHDRRVELEKGNVTTLLKALAALYLLNFYYYSNGGYTVTKSYNLFQSQIFYTANCTIKIEDYLTQNIPSDFEISSYISLTQQMGIAGMNSYLIINDFNQETIPELPFNYIVPN